MCAEGPDCANVLYYSSYVRILPSILRIIVAVAGVSAILATTTDTAQRVIINPFNFFGYFTIQSNIATVVVLFITAIASFTRRPRAKWLDLVRGCVATYIVVVGVVYNTLLAGLEGGISLPWANWVLHVAMPLYVAIDWVIVADRGPLPWHRFWLVLSYPLVWITVVLIRGASDGWVPYPFLDPGLGYGTVALYCVAIAVAVGVVGTAIWAISRSGILKP